VRQPITVTFTLAPLSMHPHTHITVTFTLAPLSMHPHTHTPVIIALPHSFTPALDQLCRYLVEKCSVAPTESQSGRRGYDGRSALHWAARNGHLDVVRWLVDDCGCNSDTSSADGTTPFCLAAWQGHLAVCRFLATRGADVHRANSFVMPRVSAHGLRVVVVCAHALSVVVVSAHGLSVVVVSA
jgi:ankyrin repeat protein